MKSNVPRFLGGITILLVFIVSGGLAPRISINTNDKVEFGQGSILTVTCDQAIQVSLDSRIDPGTGVFWLDQIELSDLSVQLHDRTIDVTLRGNDGAKLNKVEINFSVGSDGTTFTSARQHSDFVDAVSNGLGGKSEKGASKIKFTNFFAEEPIPIRSDDVKNVTLQTNGDGGCTVPTCATGGPCQIGSVGPGGGTVIYISSSPITLQGTGRTVKNLEIAPFTWNTVNRYGETVAGDPVFFQCTYSTGNASPIWISTPTMYLPAYVNSNLKQDLGYGLQNSKAIVSYSGNANNQGNCSGSSTATRQALGYRGGGLDDWFLGSAKEVLLFCQYQRNLTLDPGSESCSGGSFRAGFNPVNTTYATSSVTVSQVFNRVTLSGASTAITTGGPSESSYSVRPMRWF